MIGLLVHFWTYSGHLAVRRSLKHCSLQELTLKSSVIVLLDCPLLLTWRIISSSCSTNSLICSAWESPFAGLSCHSSRCIQAWWASAHCSCPWMKEHHLQLNPADSFSPACHGNSGWLIFMSDCIFAYERWPENVEETFILYVSYCPFRKLFTNEKTNRPTSALE